MADNMVRVLTLALTARALFAVGVLTGAAAALLMTSYLSLSPLRTSIAIENAQVNKCVPHLQQENYAPSTASAYGSKAPLQFPTRIQPSADNPFWAYLESVTAGPMVHKWVQYLDVYHRYFHKWQGKEVHLLEIGIQSGGSLDMWRTYFGSKLVYYGVDINPYTKVVFHSPPHTNIFIGSQDNRTFWQALIPQLAKVDIVLDDGGHTMGQQITTFEELYNKVEPQGIYMVEDCATSYWRGFGGSWRGGTTWMDYAKSLVDYLNADYAGEANVTATPFTRSTMSIAFFDQIVVFEKGLHAKGGAVRKGTMTMEYAPHTNNGEVDQETCRKIAEVYDKTGVC